MAKKLAALLLLCVALILAPGVAAIEEHEVVGAIKERDQNQPEKAAVWNQFNRFPQ